MGSDIWIEQQGNCRWVGYEGDKEVASVSWLDYQPSCAAGIQINCSDYRYPLLKKMLGVTMESAENKTFFSASVSDLASAHVLEKLGFWFVCSNLDFHLPASLKMPVELPISPAFPSDLQKLLPQIEWYGRLFIDPRIDNDLALRCKFDWLCQKKNRYVLWVDRQIVGFFVYDDHKLESIGILPEYRYKGFGTILLAHAIRAGVRYASVSTNNYLALQFYSKLGAIPYR